MLAVDGRLLRAQRGQRKRAFMPGRTSLVPSQTHVSSKQKTQHGNLKCDLSLLRQQMTLRCAAGWLRAAVGGCRCRPSQTLALRVSALFKQARRGREQLYWYSYFRMCLLVWIQGILTYHSVFIQRKLVNDQSQKTRDKDGEKLRTRPRALPSANIRLSQIPCRSDSLSIRNMAPLFVLSEHPSCRRAQQTALLE